MSEYHGLCTSLYRSLDARSVSRVERAIWLGKIGRYEDALSIFTQGLTNVRDVPIVLIEWSNLYLISGRYGELYRLLEKPLHDRRDGFAVLDSPEWRLLALQWVLVMTRHKGILEPALVELQRTKEWLWDLAVSEYSDIQVRSSMLTCIC